MADEVGRSEASAAVETRSFTGIRRERKTRWSVRLSDVFWRGLITLGGMSTICAVALVCVFLIYKVVPLFSPGEVSGHVEQSLPGSERSVVGLTLDEYRSMVGVLDGEGVLRVLRLDNAQLVEQRPVFPDVAAAATAWSFAPNGESVAAGFADGTVRLGDIGFRTEFLTEDEIPAGAHDLQRGTLFSDGAAVVMRTPGGQLRRQSLHVRFADPLEATPGDAVVLIDHLADERSKMLATWSRDGRAQIIQVKERKNLLTGEVTQTARTVQLPTIRDADAPPIHLAITGLGDNVWLLWEDGQIVRIDVRAGRDPRIVETLDLLPDDDERVTAAQLINGRSTVLVGDSRGRVSAWSTRNAPGAESDDGREMIRLHLIDGADADITDLTVSSRSFLAAAGSADGRIRLVNVTNEDIVSELEPGGRVQAVALGPKEDAVVAVAGGSLHYWRVRAPHHDVNLASLFRPVHYQSYPEPAHVWQSTSGDDAFEPKYGLWPLVFGTLKATVYALLFGVPMALLAAVYTSEFLHARAKAAIKPAIEMMASLPSVVLGFLAGLIIATWVEERVMAVMLAIFTLPIAFLSCARLWQLVPRDLALRVGNWNFLAMLFVAIPLGILAARWLADPVEHLLFTVTRVDAATGEVVDRDASLLAWLSAADAPARGIRTVSSGIGGWMFLLLPLATLPIAWLQVRFFNPWLRTVSSGWDHGRMALVDLLRFALTIVAAVVVALLLSWFASFFGDPRGSYLGTYIQRNALIVGFVMGFAIIPIIYTIADDALTAVPNSLRSASLGAGATPWQTAVRVVIPTAMSGIFSAIMVGLGRAVGETMIVLMAAGNTPVMDWNIFSGFRTLSANIAVELPEAPVDSTHYRVLFLAALVLFAITFALNTVAELVRQRFRKRAFEL